MNAQQTEALHALVVALPPNCAITSATYNGWGRPIIAEIDGPDPLAVAIDEGGIIRCWQVELGVSRRRPVTIPQVVAKVSA